MTSTPAARPSWTVWAEARNAETHALGRWRAPRPFDALGPTGVLTDDPRDVVSFASNDYLGLSAHPAVVAAAHLALDRWGAGSGAARLIVGSRPVHHELEEALASWRRTEAAVVFSTGAAANLGVVPSIAGPGVRVLSDALNHASIIDACRLARADGADVRTYRHTDPDHLASLLAEPGADRLVVVTDSVFSMDGDVAPIGVITELCARHDALLVVDEAHSVLQPVPIQRDDVVVLQVGTMSKTLGALGGFVAGPRAFTDLLVNRARSYIFTTALSPADAAAAHAAVAIVDSAEGDALRATLRRHVEAVRPGHPTPIVPVVLGDERRALEAAAALLDLGLLVPAIRPPTVAPDTCRLRVALSAAHTDDQVARLVAALARLAPPQDDRGAGGDRGERTAGAGRRG
jgi:8-amino-7-oxononanoate synthase